MDLTSTAGSAATETSLPAGLDHSDLENDGPKAFGDRMGTPAANEKVLWKGRPATGLLARTAFHTRTLGVYFIALIIIAMTSGRTDAAVVAAVLGTALLALLYLLAWLSARSTLYILTDTRLIMRIGMAIETRINLPLKQVTAAHLRARGNDHGDIALELAGERLLGVMLLWPHMRPWHYNRPQPMLRAVPDAAHLAQLIAETRARFGAIDQNVTAINDTQLGSGQHSGPLAPAQGRKLPVMQPNTQGFEGAPA